MLICWFLCQLLKALMVQGVSGLISRSHSSMEFLLQDAHTALTLATVRNTATDFICLVTGAAGFCMRSSCQLWQFRKHLGFPLIHSLNIKTKTRGCQAPSAAYDPRLTRTHLDTVPLLFPDPVEFILLPFWWNWSLLSLARILLL